MASRDFTEQVKVGLAAGAMLAAVAGFALARLRARAEKNEAAREFIDREPLLKWGRLRLNARQTFSAGLLIFCIAGTFNYFRYDTRTLVRDYDQYDLLHYYLNSKYFDELRYYRLLPSLIVADDEAGRRWEPPPIYLAQDDKDYFMRPIQWALDHREEIKGRFSKERWAQFSHDAVYIQRNLGRMGGKLWGQLLVDHGFNGTPTWVLIARPIASIVPVEWVKVCACLDLLWIMGMLAAVVWAFGAEAFFLSWVFVIVSYSFRWPSITWGFLRYDWFACMAIGVCMIRKEKPVAAGAFFAYATLMRYFPVLWLFGIVAKGVHALVTRRDIPLTRFWLRIPRRYWLMAAGFAVTIALLGGASVARDGLESHKQNLIKMAAHVEPHNLSSMRQGLAVTLTYRGETDMKRLSDEKRLFVQNNERWLRLGGLVMMIALGLFMTRAKDWEVVGLGFIPYFWVMTSSYYYYSMRITAVIIHAADLGKPRNVVGLLFLFGTELFCNASEHLKPENRYFLISWMGILLTAYSILMMAFLAHEWWTARKAEKAGGAPPVDG
ncbi:MAG: hypothetical protein PHU25_06720 [Deltaproteobacteria bacterium]|nr:hypothetical protein [Deltaproteobacteria bacterium]